MNPAEFDRHDFIASFGQVWRKLIIDPQGFFLAMPLTGGLGNPLVFAVLCLLLSGCGFLISGRGFRLMIFLVVWGVVRLFLGATFLLIVARKLFAGEGDFEATFRAYAYAAAPVVFLWVPAVRYFAVLYIGYLVITGLQRAQNFDSVKAVLTVIVAVIAGAVLSLPFGNPVRIWKALGFATFG